MHTLLVPDGDVLPVGELVAPFGQPALCGGLHLLLKVEREVAEWGIPANMFGIGHGLDTLPQSTAAEKVLEDMAEIFKVIVKLLLPKSDVLLI